MRQRRIHQALTHSFSISAICKWHTNAQLFHPRHLRMVTGAILMRTLTLCMVPRGGMLMEGWAWHDARRPPLGIPPRSVPPEGHQSLLGAEAQRRHHLYPHIVHTFLLFLRLGNTVCIHLECFFLPRQERALKPGFPHFLEGEGSALLRLLTRFSSNIV